MGPDSLEEEEEVSEEEDEEEEAAMTEFLQEQAEEELEALEEFEKEDQSATCKHCGRIEAPFRGEPPAASIRCKARRGPLHGWMQWLWVQITAGCDYHPSNIRFHCVFLKINLFLRFEVQKRPTSLFSPLTTSTPRN